MKLKKQLLIGVSLVLTLVLALTLGFGVFVSSPGADDSLGISGTIEYTVVDAAGNVKDHGVIHNTDGWKGHEVTAGRLFDEDIAMGVGGNDAYTAIYLTGENATGNTSVGEMLYTVPTNPLNDDAIAFSNPEGTVNRTVIDASFTSYNGSWIYEIKLVKAADNSTTLAVEDIFAWQAVSVVLTATDTVTFTWTVNID